jgi:hypothetical protein
MTLPYVYMWTMIPSRRRQREGVDLNLSRRTTPKAKGPEKKLDEQKGPHFFANEGVHGRLSTEQILQLISISGVPEDGPPGRVSTIEERDGLVETACLG